jgi:hypothetical protein
VGDAALDQGAAEAALRRAEEHAADKASGPTNRAASPK